MTKGWVRKPFKLDPLPNSPTLQAPSWLVKLKGKKATIPSFQAQSLVHLKIFYEHARDMAYFGREEKKKRKGKMSSKVSPKVKAE